MSGNPGLDVAALQGLRARHRDLGVLRARIGSHLQDHDGYLAFSGGKDSLVVLHLTHAVRPDVPVVFFDSGLEFPETYTYLEQLAELWHLNLHVLPAQPSALQILAASGAWDHHAPTGLHVPDLHQALITGPAGRAHHAHGAGELWGVRAEESRGRAAAYSNALRASVCTCRPVCTPRQRRVRHGGRIARRDGTVAYGPVWDWKTPDIWAHLHHHQLPENPVYTKLRRLGAPQHSLRVSTMIDASCLESGRLTWLKRGWPALTDELAAVLPRLREYL